MAISFDHCLKTVAALALLVLASSLGPAHADSRGKPEPMPRPPQNGAVETTPKPLPNTPPQSQDTEPGEKGQQRGGGCPYRDRKLELIV